MWCDGRTTAIRHPRRGQVTWYRCNRPAGRRLRALPVSPAAFVPAVARVHDTTRAVVSLADPIGAIMTSSRRPSVRARPFVTRRNAPSPFQVSWPISGTGHPLLLRLFRSTTNYVHDQLGRFDHESQRVPRLRELP